MLVFEQELKVYVQISFEQRLDKPCEQLQVALCCEVVEREGCLLKPLQLAKG